MQVSVAARNLRSGPARPAAEPYFRREIGALANQASTYTMRQTRATARDCGNALTSHVKRECCRIKNFNPLRGHSNVPRQSLRMSHTSRYHFALAHQMIKLASHHRQIPAASFIRPLDLRRDQRAQENAE
jgi:hypothetical protein